MRSESIFSTLLYPAVAALLVGCSASQDDGSGTGTDDVVSKDTSATLVTVKLYAEPRAKPTPDCDEHVKLVIVKDGSKLVASLENALSSTSTCEIPILKDRRTYEVKQSPDGCGSTIFEGKSGGDTLRVQDNRARVCEDPFVAAFVVDEARAGRAGSYYGKP